MNEGAIKHDGGKSPIELVDPDFIFGVSEVLKFGAKKYEPNNWRKGLAMSRAFGALMRHLWDFWRGRDYDKETGLPTLDHATCELMFLRSMWSTRRDMDDRWKPE